MNEKDSNLMNSVQISVLGNNKANMAEMVDNGLAYYDGEILNKDSIKFNFEELEKYISF